jgi:cytoskeletal protein CcmA (bactofilin family)
VAIFTAGQIKISDTAKATGNITGKVIVFAKDAVGEGVMKTTGQSAPQEFVEKRHDENDAE